MANTLRIKRRAAGGAAGAPATLANAELAFNEQDNTLYYGTGTGGAGGTATSVIAIGGLGAFVGLSGDQTVAGIKTFSSMIAGSISGNAGTATALATARTLGLSGDVTGTASFNGTANATITATLANSGVTAGSYGSATQVGQVTVDAKGRVTAASNVAITFPVTSVAGRTGAITLSTSDVSEGTNLYFTDARVRANRLDQLAAPTAAVDFNSQRITGLADPTAAQDAATKNYVDLTVQGLDPKASVKAASTANIASLSGTMTIDGVALVAGDRVLVKDQTTPSQNGVYVVASGAWARAIDLSTWDEHVSAYLFVEQGSVNADVGYLCTVDVGGTLGTTAITFVQFNGAGQIVAGNGLTKTGNTIDVGAGTGITVAADSVGLTGQALALHNLATNGIIARTAAGTVAARTLAAGSTKIAVTNGDGVAGIYLAGAYYSSNYFGWLAKLDTSGTLQWQRSLNGSGQEIWYNGAVDASGSVYVAGYSTSSGGSGNADALIAKYNSAGTLLWQRSIGGSGNEYASQMALSPDGSLLVLSGNTSTSTAGNIDALITVINTATPSVSWQRSIGSTGYDYGYGVAVDSSNNIYWLAGINGTLSLLKISSGAVIQWQKSLPSSYGSGSVNLGPDGNLRVFAPIYAGADIYQFSTDGTLLLSRSIGLDTSNGANSFSLTGLAVSSTAMAFSIYTMMDFSPYGYMDLCGAIFKVPIDGSKTGTWSVAGASTQGVTYSASSPSIGTTFWSLTFRSFSLLSRSLTSGTPSYSFAAGSYTNTTNGI